MPPSITTSALQVWNRLEPRPRKPNFERSLRAEVRDAIWMLTRQWQLGELRGEDTGSAIFAKLEMETTQVNRVSKKGATAAGYNQDIPLESSVEREMIAPDLMLRLDMGRQFLRILRKTLTTAGETPATIASIETQLKASAALQFTIPAVPAVSDADLFSNNELWQSMLAVSGGRAIDGYVLYKHLKVVSQVVSDFLSPANTNADAAGVAFVQWFERVYSQPDGATDTAWHESHLEYQFACSAPKSASAYTVLTADEYYQGHLDWYSFDVETVASRYSASLVAGAPDTSLIKTDHFSVLPSRTIFTGMPAPRWWEMEDRIVNFGGITASTTDTARLLFAEFGLIYSNDWTVLPYNVAAGSLCNLKNIVVTDVFGQRTIVRAAGTGINNDWQRWAMYTPHTRGTVSAADNRLFVPPVLARVQESEPIEEVSIMRDEMANMVWGVETIIPDGLDGGEPGYEAGLRYRKYVESFGGPSSAPPPASNTAEIKYNVMSTVPENWIPFIPIKLGTLLSRDIQLRRAALPRVINDVAVERIRPQTELLRFGYDSAMNQWNPYYIFEEEVPRSGIVVSRTWQRARWQNGKVVLWLGRRKENGRGEGNSGLRYDYLTQK